MWSHERRTSLRLQLQPASNMSSPLLDAAINAPAFASCAGPRGPSGVIRQLICCKAVTISESASLPPRELDPRITFLYFSPRSRYPASNSPSRLPLTSAAAEPPRKRYQTGNIFPCQNAITALSLPSRISLQSSGISSRKRQLAESSRRPVRSSHAFRENITELMADTVGG